MQPFSGVGSAGLAVAPVLESVRTGEPRFDPTSPHHASGLIWRLVSDGLGAVGPSRRGHQRSTCSSVRWTRPNNAEATLAA
jgi:hypothetical protein